MRFTQRFLPTAASMRSPITSLRITQKIQVPTTHRLLAAEAVSTPSGKRASEETDASVEQAFTQLRLALFGDRRPFTPSELTKPELWWSQHYHWLKDVGYLLRPRYAPDWIPSWHGTKKSQVSCEDARVALDAYGTLDATHISDGTYVMLKMINKTSHPYEVDIAQQFSSQALATSANHCVPIYDILSVPDEEDRVIIVMPLLQDYVEPPFTTIGEAVECFRQLFEGLHFMHQHRVAHRNCSTGNIMMDPNELYLDAIHPTSRLLRRDLLGFARYKTRTERPPKYFFINFGLSRRYDPSITQPLEVPIRGVDKEVPEFQNSNYPRDPFPTDVFHIGNTIRKDFIKSNLGFDFMQPLVNDMIQRDPSKRPTMEEVVQRFAAISAGLSNRKLRSRIVDKRESVYQRVKRDTRHWMRQVGYVVHGIPAMPTSLE